jgi:hypothetical protein
MSTDDQGPGGGIHAPAATQGARAIGDILEALAARLPERHPAERLAPADDPPRDQR